MAAFTPRGEAPQTARERSQTISDMTIEEMEAALAGRPTKKFPERVRSTCGPQSARTLLEENKQLIQEKRERKTLARQNSREFTEKLLAQDRRTTEGDKAKETGRRLVQRELSVNYKEKIAEKEQEKAWSYKAKIEGGVGIQYFPFVEGETISKHREMKRAQMREEMRGFLQKQREEDPPRMDSLIAETHVDHTVQYPQMSKHGGVASSIAPMQDVHLAEGDVAPHMASHPRFLAKAREHMSRRLRDVHVRKALEEQVESTKRELQALQRSRAMQDQTWEDGLLVNDALRYDNEQTKAMDRRLNAQDLQSQIEEKKTKKQAELHKRRGEIPGYWGPTEKELQDPGTHTALCGDLIRQIEVDQQRRISSRNQQLKQERRLIDNCIKEMSQDRRKEQQKIMQHREVLTTTWKSQQKIQEAIKTIEAL